MEASSLQQKYQSQFFKVAVNFQKGVPDLFQLGRPVSTAPVAPPPKSATGYNSTIIVYLQDVVPIRKVLYCLSGVLP